jgi:hypothetical protein
MNARPQYASADGDDLERLEARARQKVREYADAAGDHKAITLIVSLLRTYQTRETQRMRSRR